MGVESGTVRMWVLGGKTRNMPVLEPGCGVSGLLPAGCCPQFGLCFPVEAWGAPLGPRPLGTQFAFAPPPPAAPPDGVCVRRALGGYSRSFLLPSFL